MGNPRSFYPLSDISTKSSAKIPESNLLNMGYSVTLGDKRNYAFVFFGSVIHEKARKPESMD